MAPERPLLSPWHRIARDGDRLLFEHGGVCVALEGRAATRFLPALLPLLDGRRTLAEIVERLELPTAEPVEHALELLAAQGLLASGPPLPPDEPAPLARSAAFQAALRGGCPSPTAERERLRETALAVRGGGTVAAEIARLLLAAGVGSVERLAADDPTGRGASPPVVLAPAADETTALARWNERALADGVEWMQVLPWDGAAAVVGPVFVPGETSCWECYRRRRRSHLEYSDDLDALAAEPLRAPAPTCLDALLAGLAATLVLRRLPGDPLLAGAAAVLELGDSLRLAVHPVLRVPRCPACAQAATTALPLPWAEAS